MTIIRVLAFIPLFKNGLNILRKRKSAGNPAFRIINTASEKSQLTRCQIQQHMVAPFKNTVKRIQNTRQKLFRKKIKVFTEELNVLRPQKFHICGVIKASIKISIL